MRWKEIINEGVQGNVEGVIADVLMSLRAQGVTEVPLNSLQQEVMKRYNLDIEYSELMNILNLQPMVADANEDIVTLSSGDNISDSGEDLNSETPEDEVRDMALGGNYTN